MEVRELHVPEKRWPAYVAPQAAHVTDRHVHAEKHRAHVPASSGIRSTRKEYLVALYRRLDLLAVLFVLFSASLWVAGEAQLRNPLEFLAVRLTIANILLVGCVAFVWSWTFHAAGLYEPRRVGSHAAELTRVVLGCTAATALLMPLYLLDLREHLTPVVGVVTWAGAILALIAVRACTKACARTLRRRGAVRVLVVGCGPRGRQLAAWLQQDPLISYDMLGYADSAEALETIGADAKSATTVDGLESYLMHQVVDEVFIALPVRSQYAAIERVIHVCERAGVQSRHLADTFAPELAKPRLAHSGTTPVVTMRVVHDDHRLVIKRVLDIVGATTGLVLLAPALFGIALAVKVSSPGPVIFSQERYGRGKRRFRMHKFRTMVPDAEMLQAALESRNEAEGPVFKIRRDPRITRVGHFLRKTSLDELPQLWNVLAGEMSLVGPRPLPTRDVQRFDKPWLMRRFSVRPGLTCLWQISGRSNLAFSSWIQLDLAYIDTWSLWLDFRILARTPAAVLKGSGAA